MDDSHFNLVFGVDSSCLDSNDVLGDCRRGQSAKYEKIELLDRNLFVYNRETHGIDAFKVYLMIDNVYK